MLMRSVGEVEPAMDFNAVPEWDEDGGFLSAGRTL
jgi:hypothetical protein